MVDWYKLKTTILLTLILKEVLVSFVNSKGKIQVQNFIIKW